MAMYGRCGAGMSAAVAGSGTYLPTAVGVVCHATAVAGMTVRGEGYCRL
jgi:hypothetical protein